MDPASGFIKMNIDEFLTISTSNYLFFTPNKQIPIVRSNNMVKNIIFEFIHNNKLIGYSNSDLKFYEYGLDGNYVTQRELLFDEVKAVAHLRTGENVACRCDHDGSVAYEEHDDNEEDSVNTSAYAIDRIAVGGNKCMENLEK
jgi:hypothetical protein